MKLYYHKSNSNATACSASKLIIVEEGVQCSNCLALVVDNRPDPDKVEKALTPNNWPPKVGDRVQIVNNTPSGTPILEGFARIRKILDPGPSIEDSIWAKVEFETERGCLYQRTIWKDQPVF